MWLRDVVAIASTGKLLLQTNIALSQNTTMDTDGPKSDRSIVVNESVAMQKLLVCKERCRELRRELCNAMELYPQTLEQDAATLAKQQEKERMGMAWAWLQQA